MLATLYKKTETGSIAFWEVSVNHLSSNESEVTTRYGYVGSENIQATSDTVTEGKNKGKVNETSTNQQAELQAKQAWDKKIKSGYVTSLEKAELGITELEGIKPMLAQKFEDRVNKLKFPVYVQPKLDGMRCISICTNGSIRLFTRTQKEIRSLPHIEEALARFIPSLGINWMFDGEIYSHTLKDDFNTLMSYARSETPCEGAKVLEYWVYDLPHLKDSNTGVRCSTLEKYWVDYYEVSPHVKFIPTKKVNNLEEIFSQDALHLKLGYEGSMVRLDGPYENKRSQYLLKLKKFQDEEFEIIGFMEGSGKLQGHIGSFTCVTKEGKEFSAKLDGETSRLKYLFENFDQICKGKLLTVKFFDWTPDRIPRFPVGKAIREE